MNRTSLIFVILLFLFACKNDEITVDPFAIETLSIGMLTDSTQVKDLDMVFAQDSITKYIGGDEFIGDINDFQVYDTSGKLLLELTPREDLDSTSTIKTVRILDSRFSTDKGLNNKSLFGTIKSQYTISSIQNTLRNVIVSIDDINVYFTIDKNKLPAAIKFETADTITIDQIPDNAVIKDLYIQWY